MEMRVSKGSWWSCNHKQECRAEMEPLRFQDVDAAAAFYSCHREATVLNRDRCICIKKCSDIPASLLRLGGLTLRFCSIDMRILSGRR